jgi:hypothetical protein
MDRRRGAPGPTRSTDEDPRRARLLRAKPQSRHTAARPGQGCLQHAYAPHWAGRRPTFVRQLHQLLLQAAALLAAGLHHEHLRDGETTLCPAAPPCAPSARPNRAHLQAGGEAGAAGERAGSCHAARRRILSSNARASGTHHAPGPLSAHTHAQTGVLAGATQPFLRAWANHMLSPSQTLLGRRSAAESQSPGVLFLSEKVARFGGQCAYTGTAPITCHFSHVNSLIYQLQRAPPACTRCRKAAQPAARHRPYQHGAAFRHSPRRAPAHTHNTRVPHCATPPPGGLPQALLTRRRPARARQQKK